MSEWWTYTLSDFLMFSPRTWYRLIEIHNAAVWPAQIAAALLGLAIFALLLLAPAAGRRWIPAALAACWLFVAIAFHARRYATINWAAVYFAWAFGLEAALLVWAGVVRGRLAFEPSAGRRRGAGLSIFLFAFAAYPLVAPLLRRGWRQAEVFGVAPDPTAVATLGLLLLAAGPGSRVLIVIPAVWCAVSGATLLAMKAPDAWIAPLAAAIVVFLALRSALARRRSRRPAG